MLLALFSIGYGQSVTRSVKNMSANQTYITYTGVAGDTLTILQDTVRIPFFTNKEYPLQFYISATLNPRTTTDTIITMNVYGKVFSNQSWAKISAATVNSSAVATNTEVITSSLLQPTYTFTFDTTKYNSNKVGYYVASMTAPSVVNHYRYLMVEFITKGDDNTGTGAKVTSVSLKIWQKQ